MDGRKEIVVSDINELFNELFEMQKSGSFVFRGISKNSEFLPSLIRHYDERNLKGKSIGIIPYEKWLLEQYGRYSIQYLPSFFKPLDWVASAQHFGLPTRLIDWTFDPFCALFFAIFSNTNPEGDYYQVLVVNKENHLFFDDIPLFEPDISADVSVKLLDQYIVLVQGLLAGNIYSFIGKIYMHGTRRQNFANAMKAAEDEEYQIGIHKLFFCTTYDSNPRIIAQKGLFQIPRRFVVNNQDIIEKDIINGCEKIYKINKDLRNDILSLLEKLNISTPRLFPDLQNICSYLKNINPKL